QTLTAVQALGLGTLTPAPESLRIDTGFIRVRAESLHADSLAHGNYVFDVDVLRRRTTQFLPQLTGPVDPMYRLGPGDVLVAVLSGAIDQSYLLDITREGFVIIPQVGQIYLNNLTLEAARSVLFDRLGRVYSKLRGPNPTIKFDVTVSRVRINQVYVVGEVKQPGAYQISALGTALTALYAAGGITTRANMRGIEVLRLNQVAATLDLYDYLLRGDKSGDLRLETGDVVYVPLRGKRTQITGAVPRPAIYELKAGEALADLVHSAGGFRQDAALERVTIHRILPAAVRGTGPFPRAVMNVPMFVALPAGQDPPGSPAGEPINGVLVPALGLENGDSVVVDSIAPLDSSYFVAISGAVNKAGRFPW